MGRLRTKTDYEELRNARIAENQARMASLGVEKTAGDLKAFFSTVKSGRTTPRKHVKVVYDRNHLRRSHRLKEKSSEPHTTPANSPTPTIAGEKKSSFTEPVRRSYRRKLFDQDEGDEIRPANAPLLEIDPAELQLPAHVLARRCDSKNRGSVYDSILGICCHFCRQKKLCGEEDCKRCGDRDMGQPCIEMEEVRKNKNWMCPHCIEAQGINPYWICNSSFCLKKRNIAPTGIAIYKAREMGYESVAHLLMDNLKKTAGVDKRRRQ